MIKNTYHPDLWVMMKNTYHPDRWVMIKFTRNGKSEYRVLAGWGGGYHFGSLWKLNSGCTKVEQDGDYYLFYGFSGSIYRCHKYSYGTNAYTAQILERIMNDSERIETNVELMPENTNWLEDIEYDK